MLRAADYAEDFQLLASQYAMLTLQDDQFTEQGRQDRLLDGPSDLQETREYFANTKVVAAIVPREGGTEDSVTQKFTKGNMFTHHQKSVIIDAQDPRSGPHSFCCDTSLTKNLN